MKAEDITEDHMPSGVAVMPLCFDAVAWGQPEMHKGCNGGFWAIKCGCPCHEEPEKLS